MMVLSQRETNISSNIRAIIKQLNLNPIENKNYFKKERDNNVKNIKINNHVNKINIGVYGYNDDYESNNNFNKQKSSTRQKIVITKTTTTKSSNEHVEQIRSHANEDLPQLEIDRLNHPAAMHRITIRPKNRRPPKRMSSKKCGPSSNIPTISEGSDNLDSLETSSTNDSPIESKNVMMIRQTTSSTNRLTKTSEIFGELEAKLNCSPSLLSKSPDSLNNSILSKTSNSFELDEDNQQLNEIKPVMRKLSNRISKGSDIFAELSSKLPRRRSSINRTSKSPDSLENDWSKSTDSFDVFDELKLSKPVLRKSLNFVSKSTDRVSKSSDSLETLDKFDNNLNSVNSDDSIERRRRSSYEFRNVQRTSSRMMSKSSESFEALEEIKNKEINDELKKGSSASDMINITCEKSKESLIISKSSQSVDNLEITVQSKSEPKRSSSDISKRCWRPTKRTTMSSESSDNLELDDELENRRSRKPPKRIPSTSIVDIVPIDNLVNTDMDKKPPLVSKLSRFQKSSESSELGSTDTLDSDKKNKSSASTETLDSLEKDLDQDGREEDINADDDIEKREKNESWSGQVTDTSSMDMDDTKQQLISDKSYWRQSTKAKENIDIHQLLAITIVTHMADNGNQRNSVLFPKKKLSTSSSPPSSPEKQQDDNKIMFNNLLSSKNDEDLQNMLNGNISEVSTDTKSFKEKLIMFEKLGK